MSTLVKRALGTYSLIGGVELLSAYLSIAKNGLKHVQQFLARELQQMTPGGFSCFLFYPTT